MASIYDVGLSGMQLAKYAMVMTGNNIANANNPYFARRTLHFGGVTSGWNGLGIKPGDVRRISDAAADAARIESAQLLSRDDALYSRLSHFESFFDSQNMGIDKLLNQAVSALDTLNTSPASMQNRNNYLFQLNVLVNRFHDLDQNITAEMGNARTSVQSGLEQANDLLAKLAALNGHLEKENNPLSAASMNLMDTRDELLEKLSALINFDKKIQDNGSVNLFWQNGQPLLIRQQAGSFSVNSARDLHHSPEITFNFQDATMHVNPFLSQGEVGGILAYYDDVLVKSQQSLDKIAMVFSQKMNGQNQHGVDLYGTLGGDLFNDINHNRFVYDRVTTGQNNTGSADINVSIQDASQLESSDYDLHFIDDQHYELVRRSDHHVVQAGALDGGTASIAVDGFTVNINTAHVAAGDHFMISPLKGGAQQFNLLIQDAGKIALASPIMTSASSSNQGSGRIHMSAIVDTNTSAFSLPGALHPPVRVEFITATTYRLVSADDNHVIEDNLVYDDQLGADVFPTPGSYDPGYRITLSGSMSAGDHFSIDFNANGQGDNRNGLLFSSLYLANTMDHQHLTFAQAYQQLTMDIATDTHQAQINLESSRIIKTQADMRRDEYSGVSLEEEMLNLSRYQEYYMASAQVLETVKQNMDILFSLIRGR